MSDTPTEGPVNFTIRSRTHDFRWFDRIVRGLQEWRNADHEDAKMLHRNEIIEIIEGIRALKGSEAVGVRTWQEDH